MTPVLGSAAPETLTSAFRRDEGGSVPLLGQQGARSSLGSQGPRAFSQRPARRTQLTGQSRSCHRHPREPDPGPGVAAVWPGGEWTGRRQPPTAHYSLEEAAGRPARAVSWGPGRSAAAPRAAAALCRSGSTEAAGPGTPNHRLNPGLGRWGPCGAQPPGATGESPSSGCRSLFPGSGSQESHLGRREAFWTGQSHLTQ